MWRAPVVKEIDIVHIIQMQEARRAASSATETMVRTLPRPRMELRYLRVARGPPRAGSQPRQRTRCGPLSSCATNIAVMLKTPGVATTKALNITLKTRRADMHAMMLAKRARGRRIVMGLLLT